MTPTACVSMTYSNTIILVCCIGVLDAVKTIIAAKLNTCLYPGNYSVAGLITREGKQKLCGYHSPKPIRVPVTQIRSEINRATDRAPLIDFPYLIWNGSIIVTYFLSLIGLAKKSPP